jgi:hypothetical protein
MRKFLGGLFAFLPCVIVFDVATAAPPPPITGICTPAKAKFLSSVNSSSTSSTTPVNFMDNRLNFVQGGASASCVIVRFSAMVEGVSGYNVAVSATIDGTNASLPAEVLFSDGGDLNFQVRSFDFIFPSVAPGSHLVRIQFRSPTAISVSIAAHNIIVQYR